MPSSFSISLPHGRPSFTPSAFFLAYKYYMDMVFDEEFEVIFAYVIFLNHKC